MKLSAIPSTLFFVWMLGCCSVADAQWLPTGGPDNGTITGLYAIDSTLFAATNDYVYSTTDHGETWKQLRNGLLYNNVDCITGQGPYLFAGTNFSGLYRSADLGNSWTPIRGILPTNYISSFAWNGSTLYMGGLDGVYRTTDLGKNWTKTVGVGMETRVRSVASIKTMLFVGLSDSGLLVSADSGKTWKKGRGPVATLSVFTFHAADSTLFAGTDSGIYVLRARDSVWKNADTLLNRISVHQFVKLGTKIYAATDKGILLSADSGTTWNFVLRREWTANMLSIAAMGNELYAGTGHSGVRRSTDGGNSWQQTNALSGRVSVSQIAVDDSLVATASQDGIHLSTDDGRHWKDLSTDSSDYAQAVVFHKGTLYAGCWGGLFAWDRSAGTFTNLWSKRSVYSIAFNGDSIYIGGFDGLYRSTDGGKNFVPDTFFTKSQVYTIGAFGAVIFVGSSNGLYRSSDHGRHWTLALPSPDNIWVARFARNDSFYFAGTMSGLYRMAVGDTVWYNSSAGLANNTDVTGIAISGKHMFVGLRGGGLAHSSDGGNLWYSANTAQTQYMNVFDLGLNSRRIFFGGAYTSVWSAETGFFGITSVEQRGPVLPDRLILSHYPNPFNPSTRIRFELPERSQVRLTVYDLLGREVAHLVNGEMEAGMHEVPWDAGLMSAGVYLARCTANGRTETRKMLLVK